MASCGYLPHQTDTSASSWFDLPEHKAATFAFCCNFAQSPHATTFGYYDDNLSLHNFLKGSDPVGSRPSSTTSTNYFSTASDDISPRMSPSPLNLAELRSFSEEPPRSRVDQHPNPIDNTSDQSYAYAPALGARVTHQETAGRFLGSDFEQDHHYLTSSSGQYGHSAQLDYRAHVRASSNSPMGSPYAGSGRELYQQTQTPPPINFDHSPELSWAYTPSLHNYQTEHIGSMLPVNSISSHWNIPGSDCSVSSRGHSPSAFSQQTTSTTTLHSNSSLYVGGAASNTSSFHDRLSSPVMPIESPQMYGSSDVHLIHCSQCTQRFASREQFAKHQAKHQKLHRCRIAGCTRTEGFTTPNDRDRHEKSVHKTPGLYFRCMDENCGSYEKTFARRDNLKDHLKRMHKAPPEMDEAQAIEWRNELADQWRVDLSPAMGPAR